MSTERFGTLTADGARLLRQARDQIIAKPHGFDMGVWDCGSYACIGGHLQRLTDRQGWLVGEALGFTDACCHSLHPLFPLFYGFEEADRHDVARAIEKINAFLWQYGYPPEELAQEAVPEPVLAHVES